VIIMLEIIMAQFGKRIDVEPTLSSFKKYFDGAKYTLYTDKVPSDDIGSEFNDVCIIKPPFNKTHSRYGNRCNDLYKVIGLLDSSCDVSIAVDSDMQVCSTDVYSILNLTKKFGACLPANSRNLVGIDNEVGADSIPMVEDFDNGYITNMSPISFSKDHQQARDMLNNYCDRMLKNPQRGPQVMWQAMWDTGFFPCLLPLQWCVCEKDIGIGHEIILHVGHQKVREHYGSV
jgi:hypothetical protein